MLYATGDQVNLELFNNIIQTDQTWETRFIALAYIEWALYRGIINTEEQLENLRPTLIHIIQLNDAHLNEKLMSLLFKLRELGKFSDLLEILMKTNLHLFKFLESLNATILTPETHKINNISITLPKSIGRNEEIAEVTQKLLECKELAIVGLPGMGKLCLATAIAQKQIPYFEIVWLCNAKTKDTLNASLLSLALELGLVAGANECAVIIRHRLRIYKKVLFLLADADHLMLPKYNQLKVKGVTHFLITSTNLNFDNPYLIKAWPEFVAVDFFKQNLKEECSDLEAEQLVRMLSCVPRALESAKSLLNLEGWSVAELIHKLKQDITILDYRDNTLVNLIQTSLYKLIETYLDMKKSLCLRALLSPDSVQLALFDVLATNLNLEWRSSTTLAESVLLIEFAPDSTSMHRLVQTIVLQTYSDCAISILPQLIQSLIALLEKLTDTRELLRCIWSTLEYIIERGLVSNYSSFCIDLLMKYFDQGITEGILEALLKVNKIISANLQSLSPSKLAKMCCMLERGRYYEDALNYASAALENIEIEEPLDQAFIYVCVGSLYQSTNRWAEAENCYFESLRIQISLDSMSALLEKTCLCLGALFESSKQFGKAENLYKEFIKVLTEKLGPKHSSLLTMKQKLDELYETGSRMNEAEECNVGGFQIQADGQVPSLMQLNAADSDLLQVLSKLNSLD